MNMQQRKNALAKQRNAQPVVQSNLFILYVQHAIHTYVSLVVSIKNGIDAYQKRTPYTPPRIPKNAREFMNDNAWNAYTARVNRTYRHTSIPSAMPLIKGVAKIPLHVLNFVTSPITRIFVGNYRIYKVYSKRSLRARRYINGGKITIK